jgi:hypothetical protein
MEPNKVEKWTMEDGRKAEKTVVEKKLENEEVERVIEIKIENERPLSVQQRIVERYKPFVYERKIETIDPDTGKVIDVKIESSTEETCAQQSDSENSTEKDYVTRKEMVDAIVNAIKSSKDNKTKECKINSLGLVQEISSGNNNKYDLKNIFLSCLVVLQIFGLIYLLFLN